MSNRKGKGKAKVTSNKRKRPQPSTEPATLGLSERKLNEKDKADKATPSNKSYKFANLYCELRFLHFDKRNLIMERKLAVPSDLKQYTECRVVERGWVFLDRELVRVNESWVREFYCNFYRVTLDAIHLRDRQILITKAIEYILHFQPKISNKDAFHQAKEDIKCMSFDWDAVHCTITLPDASWEQGSKKETPRGIKLDYLMKEAKLW
ncbi:uncharacterized protein [Arachis hypogaea]|uniref:uncharacterized protein n=1 Tax=Arachis hypogaea TaxID=3818 RepID=UPI000DEC0C47